jgi:putative addiction module CopG family antidote
LIYLCPKGLDEASILILKLAKLAAALALPRSFSYPKAMEIQLTPDQKAFVRQAIASGRLRREEDAVQEALLLWEERERSRAEILAAVDEAEASLSTGGGRTISEQSMRDLAEEVKRRGRIRFKAE